MQANDPILEQLRTKIREHLNNAADNMAGGSCKSYPDYTHMTGIVYGLGLAERELLDIDQRLTED